MDGSEDGRPTRSKSQVLGSQEKQPSQLLLLLLLVELLLQVNDEFFDEKQLHSQHVVARAAVVC